LNEKTYVYNEYKEQVFPQHIVVNESDKHNSIDEGYQQPDIFMVTKANQQIYENILPISHEQSEPVYEQTHTSGVDKENIEQLAKVTMFGYQYFSSFFYDPVAMYMESCFTEDFSLAIFGIRSEYDDYKYVLQVEILLQVMKFSLNFICMQRDFVIGSMLSWLHWKHDVT